jgi:hypothetical protein
VPASEEPGKADNNTAESPEEHENAGGGTDRLFEAIQIAIVAMPLLIISSIVLAIVFFIQANRYHNHFMTFLALWFLVLGFQALSLFGLHIINIKLGYYDKYGCVDAVLEIILATILLALPWGFISAEPILIGKINMVERYINAITIALTVFFFIVWLFDTAYAIYEAMPIRVD